jgi:hypothetical protein
MQARVSDRRITRRHFFKTRLRVRIWKSTLPEWRAESDNLLQPNGSARDMSYASSDSIPSEESLEWACGLTTTKPSALNRINRAEADQAGG